MATWTKIEDGMAKGGTAIQAALEAINNAKQEASDLIHQTVTNGTISIDFYRKDSLCTASATFSTSAALSRGGVICDVPSGFIPATYNRRAIAKGGTVAYMLLFNDTQLTTNDAIPAGTYVSFQAAYFTDDDLPD